jgi:arylsulfatase
MIPPARYLEPYLERDLPLPELDPDDLEGQPSAYKELRQHNVEVDHDSISWTLDPTPEQLQRLRAHYMANVTLIDEKIGEILAALEEGGYLENAVVIFTSDHGDCLGDHGHIQKWTMYDIITRTPLIVWAPGRYEGGREIDALVQQFDIAPVVMELAGLPVPASWEARSLSPLLEASAEGPLRTHVYAEQVRDGILTGTEMMTMVRDERWKLVHLLGNEDGGLYDLETDPGESRNLWHEPEAQRKARGAAGEPARLAHARRDTHCRLGCALAVMCKGHARQPDAYIRLSASCTYLGPMRGTPRGVPLQDYDSLSIL